LRGPDILDNPDFIPSASLIEEAQDYYKGMTIERDEGRPRKILAPQRYFGGETQMVKEYLKDQIRDRAPVGVDVGKETEAVDAGPSQTSANLSHKEINNGFYRRTKERDQEKSNRTLWHASDEARWKTCARSRQISS
jgi:hypothetical protein